MRPDELEKQLRERLDALGPAPRAEPLHVLMLPDTLQMSRLMRVAKTLNQTMPPPTVTTM